MTGELVLRQGLEVEQGSIGEEHNEDALSGSDDLAEFRGLSWRDWR